MAFLSALMAILAWTRPADADQGLPLPRDNFGGVGLIEMPSARMAPDGELSAGASFFENTQHYDLGFQILPWLEGSFRYSGLQHFRSDYPTYYDRSLAVKMRLWNETDNIPALAVGVNDILGTGVYGGEYAVFSKNFGDIDVSFGMGWGRLSTANSIKNPLGQLFPSFRLRVNTATGVGQFTANEYFHGPNAGLFGGALWHTPIDGLSLIAEISSDAYVVERLTGNFNPRTQLNIGASYQMTGNTTLGINWLYGRTVGGSISIQLDPTTDQSPEKLGPEPPPVNIRSDAEQQRALASLLQQGAGVPVPNSSFRAARAASKNTFVDALWRDAGNVRDIELRGRVLLLRGSAVRDCTPAAQLARAYGGDIDTIVLNDGRTNNRCPVLRAPSLIFVRNNTADTAQVRSYNGVATAELSTIDAALPTSDMDAELRAIRHDADQQRIFIEAVSLSENEAIVYYSNSHYFAERDALDRLVRILMADAPPTIEKFRLVAIQDGVPQREFNVLRGFQERSFTQEGRLDLFSSVAARTTEPPPLQNPILEEAAHTSYPRFSWDIFPQFRQELFDPSNPFAVQFLLAADGKLELLQGLWLNAEVETSLYDNFNENRPDDSLLPHVRSDFLKYFAQGKTGIGELDAKYRFRLAPNVFAVAKAGYLESMFAGVGGEVLWRPENQRWALGGDLYEVWQRDFNRLFGLQTYHVPTGHISIYYASPWYDLNFVLRAGQYLAGDRGLTFEATRRFSTGVEIGAFVTRTDVSAAQFGEGSFDKGIIIRIPLGWIAPIETQGRLDLDLRPVQRDGGQRLVGDTMLYDETQRTSYGDILREGSGLAIP